MVIERLRRGGAKETMFAARRDKPAEPELPLRGEYSLPKHFNSAATARERPADWHAGKPNCGVD